MSTNINSYFRLTEDDIEQYQKKGFIKLKKIFTEEAIDFFKATVHSETKQTGKAFSGFFSRMSYGILDNNSILLDIFSDTIFSDTITRLNNTSLFFTQGIGFELVKNKDIGFPWHHGSQSFGYIRPQDLACTLWIPLTKIDTKQQRGGMAYVPIDRISAEFMFSYVDAARVQYIRDKLNSQELISEEDVLELETGILASPVMKKLLNHFQVEDDFEPGDAFLFNKYVIHKSIKLEEGPIDSRMAFVMRFVDANARYFANGAEDLDLPRRELGYKVGTTFHIDVCKQDGDKISESDYFDANEKRLLKFK